jgi:hypothetical protein
VHLIVNGEKFRAVNLFTARGRDLMALQHETGYGLDEITAMAGDKTRQTEVNKFLEFLSERNRGNFLTWDEILDRPLVAPQPDPDDLAKADDGADDEAEDGDEVPTPASTGSPTVDAVPADAPAPAKARTRKSSSSGGTSRGSTSRSRTASSQ